MSLWYTRSWFWRLLLWPFSLPWLCVTVCRRQLYAMGWFKVTQVAAKVIVVGNITVGGTGKTPVIIALAADLLKKGQRVGIISRGYRGRYRSPVQAVHPDSAPVEVGDEPVLLAQKTGCPVYVARRRVLAAQQLLLDHPDCEIILSDDGMQHWALARDETICVIDGVRRFGNGLCLPVGPCRELPGRRFAATERWCMGGTAMPGEKAVRRQYGLIYAMGTPEKKLDPKLWQGRPVHVCAAIAQPQRFFDAVREMGFDCTVHAFPDHHLFTAEDFAFSDGQTPIIITEKDAVKCRNFAHLPLWCLPLVVVC